ncbi:unnamed protein product [Cercopithifilaria johnstoni]|uniref:Uncharacterized protein n=1 Tax=Cercopithifilaria johnstoni TaxID=2874296 RepID=A0A8J2LM05_9BILA|nr:unnamed protein product [Cercopithifilaria johnstoni]
MLCVTERFIVSEMREVINWFAPKVVLPDVFRIYENTDLVLQQQRNLSINTLNAGSSWPKEDVISIESSGSHLALLAAF